ncbi:MAG: FlgD immunoglobulin-like domain containing protein [bacterium]
MVFKIATRMPALFLILLTILGFNYFTHHKPKHLGLHRAQISDRGLLELAIDQIRQGLNSGATALLERTLANDFVEGTAPEPGKLSRLFTKDNLTALSQNGHPGLGLVTTEFHIVEDRAVVRGSLTAASGTSGTPVELTFAKRNHQWKLVASKNLFASMDRLDFGASASFDQDGTTNFDLFAETENSTDETFIWQPVSKEHHVERLTKSVTQNKLDRQLFQKPYAGVLYSSVTQLDRAPFFKARYVELITDPAWNRVVYGDYDGWIKAYGHAGAGSEDLNRPHGIDRDAEGNVYVADTGNNRIAVLRLVGNGKNTELEFQFELGSGELMHPYDVAWDDAGTPFDSSDDFLWVTDTGHDRIVGYAIRGQAASLRYTFGQRGNAAGDFFSPQAIAVGKFNGLSNEQLYVADTGNRRLVHLDVSANTLHWLTTYPGKAESQFTSVDVDHWGNVYVTDCSYREILKLSADLQPLSRLKGANVDLVDPLNYSVTFGQVTVDSEDKKYWAGYDQALVLERWSDHSGGERYQLGLALLNFQVKLSPDLDHLVVHSKLTDPGKVTLTVIDASTQLTVRQIPIGWMMPGEKQVLWDRRDDLGWPVEPGGYRLQLTAESSYGKLTVVRETPKFYLPLYYWDDSGAEKRARDPHLIQGIRSSQWGSKPYQTIAKHPSEVVYRFTNLNPTVDYELKAEFYNKVGLYLKQRIVVDEAMLYDDFEVPSGLKELDWLQLPRELYSDGQIEVHIAKTAGDTDAMISQLWLRESHFDPSNPPDIVENSGQAPEQFVLSQNYPNPFNPATTIEFGVPGGATQNVTLRIFDVLGQTVKVLVDKQLPPGRHSVTWNGKDSFGRPVSSGLYFYQLKAGDFDAVKKLMLMK